MSQRLWWARAALVLIRPVEVFTALRDESVEEAQAREEPVLAIVLLAGIAGVLATTLAGDVELGGVELAVWAFLGGALEGFALYFVVGALAFVGGSAAGSTWRYRHARHVLAYAVVPLAASLPVWAVRLAFDADLDLVLTGVLAWCAGLLVVGVRVLHAWPWWRAVAAAALPLLVPVLVLLRAYSVL
ncbi:MAG: YIP1 family protein [Gaiellaceae bacterium]